MSVFRLCELLREMSTLREKQTPIGRFGYDILGTYEIAASIDKRSGKAGKYFLAGVFGWMGMKHENLQDETKAWFSNLYDDVSGQCAFIIQGHWQP